MFSDAIINEIKFEHLNTKCLIQISKFARILHRYNGSVLKLQDKNIVAMVMHHCQINNHPELNKIFDLLTTELEACIINTELERSLPSQFSLSRKAQDKPLLIN